MACFQASLQEGLYIQVSECFRIASCATVCCVASEEAHVDFASICRRTLYNSSRPRSISVLHPQHFWRTWARVWAEPIPSRCMRKTHAAEVIHVVASGAPQQRFPIPHLLAFLACFLLRIEIFLWETLLCVVLLRKFLDFFVAGLIFRVVLPSITVCTYKRFRFSGSVLRECPRLNTIPVYAYEKSTKTRWGSDGDTTENMTAGCTRILFLSLSFAREVTFFE